MYLLDPVFMLIRFKIFLIFGSLNKSTRKEAQSIKKKLAEQLVFEH